MKKKVIILTLNDYIIYQPTILSLYDALTENFDVEVISFQPVHATRQKDEKRKITYLATNKFVSELYQKTDFILSKFTSLIRKFKPGYIYYHKYYNHYLPSILRKTASRYREKSDIVIAVDLQVLYLAQQLFGKVHFLSLEIDNNTNTYYKRIDINKISSVFVQSKLRYDYLFPNSDLPVFYIQNAPTFEGVNYPLLGRKDFVWAGAIDKRLAILDCLEFFKSYPQYKMVLKGGANPKMLEYIKHQYSEMLDEKRITINQQYLEAGEFIHFLSKYRIGFCFYNWKLIAESFNYQTAPSGKLFMCLAAGTPVIGCNIAGFQLIKEFHAGVLIDDYEPATIENAVRTIEANYESYSAGCYKAAAHFSFKQAVEPYINHLLTSS